MTAHVEVAVIGAGFAGIGLAVRLGRRGADFAVFERADSVGGTWRDNRYPGVACDVPSHLYCFSFAPRPEWPSRFAAGADIRTYLEQVSAEVGDRIHLRTEVLDARRDGDRWLLRTSAGDWTATVLVLAAGRLTEPRIPDVQGLAEFAGDVFHSARWRDDVPLDGRRVTVVGSGASAVQLVPELAGRAAQLTVLQRSAPYVVPREDRPYSDAERALFARDAAELVLEREQLFWRMEEQFAARAGDGALRAEAAARARAHLETQVPDARLRGALTPEYDFGCKRVLLSDDYYPALIRDDVTLVPSALAAVRPDAVVAADGTVHPTDVLVLATGFVTTKQPYASIVHAADGGSLDDHWAGGMTSYASTVVAGFPDLFLIDGPNGALGHNSAVAMIEAQIEYVLGALAHRATTGLPLAVTLEAERAYTAELDRRAADSVWMTGGCSNWYVDPASRRLTLLWPDFAYAYAQEFGEFDPAPYEGTL